MSEGRYRRMNGAALYAVLQKFPELTRLSEYANLGIIENRKSIDEESRQLLRSALKQMKRSGNT